MERLVEFLAFPDIVYHISYHCIDVWLLALKSLKDGISEIEFVNLLQFPFYFVGNLIMVFLYVVHEILQLLNFFICKANVDTTNPCLDVVVGDVSRLASVILDYNIHFL